MHFSPAELVPKLAPMTDDRHTDSRGRKPMRALTVKRTTNGYWTVQRGSVQLAFAMTREAAEHERETLERLGMCSERRSRRRQPSAA